MNLKTETIYDEAIVVATSGTSKELQTEAAVKLSEPALAKLREFIVDLHSRGVQIGDTMAVAITICVDADKRKRP